MDFSHCTTILPATAHLPAPDDPIGPSLASADDCRPRATALPRGELLSMRLSADQGFEYFAYLPHSAPRHAPILITVHGISRNARQHVRMMAALAERHGVALLAPLFRRGRFPGYQRLEADARGVRPDALLRQALREFATLSGASDRRLYLFGFSGGAQFVHRWVMRSPQRVAGYVVAAAGWYTFPDESACYPHGLRRNRRLGTPRLDAEAFLRIPGLAVVGELDNRRDRALRSCDRVVDRQGRNRLERGRSWVEAMNEAARDRGLAAPLRFAELPRATHSFAVSMRRGEMGEQVFRFLFDDAPGADGRRASGVSWSQQERAI